MLELAFDVLMVAFVSVGTITVVMPVGILIGIWLADLNRY